MNLRVASCAIGVLLMMCAAQFVVADDQSQDGGWKVMFDGKSLDGWTAKETPESFKVENGEIVVHGKRGHLFYTAEDKPFKNFEFEAEVKTTPGSNSGIYFHTKPQDSGWPKYGFEAQVCGPKGKDPKKTGSLYGVVNVPTAPPDDEWFKYNIRVEGKRAIIKINDKVVVDYTEPADAKAGKEFTRVLDEGTIALQAHDPDSKVFYRNLRIRRLP
jgi:hypothetical protein